MDKFYPVVGVLTNSKAITINRRRNKNSGGVITEK
jgi:hypothetical protein